MGKLHPAASDIAGVRIGFENNGSPQELKIQLTHNTGKSQPHYHNASTWIRPRNAELLNVVFKRPEHNPVTGIKINMKDPRGDGFFGIKSAAVVSNDAIRSSFL
jgi:hypothetical protein